MDSNSTPVKDGKKLSEPFMMLAEKVVASFYEPIFSVQKMGVVGLEAHYRGVDPKTFDLVGSEGLLRSQGVDDFQVKLELNRLFRERGLEGFKRLSINKPNLLLFMEVEPTILVEGTVGSGYLRRQVTEHGLAPQQLVVEIPLAPKMDTDLVLRFIHDHQNEHYLVCLKNVLDGAPYRDLLMKFNPDLIKLEDGMVQGLARNPEKRTHFIEAVKLAHELGIVVVTGGLDNEEDALTALELGSDLLQGSYFTQKDKYHSDPSLGLRARMAFLAHRFRRRLEIRANQTWGLKNKVKKLADALFLRLKDVPVSGMEKEFRLIMDDYPGLECLYLLDSRGIQVSETVCSSLHIPERKRFLFQPSTQGTDHSLEEHFYALSDTRPDNLTEPYLSMNSGHLCVTASKMIVDMPSGVILKSGGTTPSGVGTHSGEVYQICADLNFNCI